MIMSAPDDDIHPQAAIAPGYLVNHAAKVFNRSVDAKLRPHGLSLALLGPLLLLSWKGSMRQRDLVRLSAVRQPAMVALLDKLESLGLIERTRSIDDRRAATVRLTESGQAAALLGGNTLIEVNRIGVAGFSIDEATAVVGLLQSLIRNLEAD